MFCEKCGAQVEEDTLFCPDCGNRIGGGEDVFKEKDDISGLNAVSSRNLVIFSEDGKYIFYPQDYENSSSDGEGYYKTTFDLYYKPVKDKNSAGEKLASSVGSGGRIRMDKVRRKTAFLKVGGITLKSG